MSETTKETGLVDRLLGGIAFEFPAGGPKDCCFEMLAAWRGRKVAGARRECPECGALAKAVVLDGRQAAPDDMLVCGAGSPGAVEKERDVGFRVAGVYAATGAEPPAELVALFAGASETERGRWAGNAPEYPLVAPVAGGAFVVLEEVSVAASRSARTAREGMTASPTQVPTAHGGGSGRRQENGGMARSGGDLTLGPNAARTSLPEKAEEK